MYSTRGRPRQVTDAQVERILEWRRTHKPISQLARELNLKKTTVEYVISIEGRYKQVSPELREAAQEDNRRRRRRLRAAGWL